MALLRDCIKRFWMSTSASWVEPSGTNQSRRCRPAWKNTSDTTTTNGLIRAGTWAAPYTAFIEDLPNKQ